MSPLLLLLIYCSLILLVSLAGGWIPMLFQLTHRRMQFAISLVAGVMLGVGLLHMLPHALLEAPGQANTIFIWVLVGFLTMFFIERFLCFHHHDVPKSDQEENGSTGRGHHVDDHSCAGAQNQLTDISHEAHHLNWIGAGIGLTLHTVIAGIALASSVEIESRGEHMAALAGFGAFMAISLHKPFDAMTITTLMAVGKWSKRNMHLVNGVFALMVPVGVALFYLGLSQVGEGLNLVAYALAFSAGTFLCVSMSDLLPELQFHVHDRVGLSMALILGLSIAGGIGLMETQDHDHSGHGHDVADVEDQGTRHEPEQTPDAHKVVLLHEHVDGDEQNETH